MNGIPATVPLSTLVELPPDVPKGELKFAQLWLVWQLSDSAFPAGSFAHSGGVEAAWQHGQIASASDLSKVAKACLLQAGWGSLPFINEIFSHPDNFAALDKLNDSFISNHVANRASRAQGQSWLMVAERSFHLPGLVQFRANVVDERLPGHFAPVFAAVARQLGLSHDLAIRLFLHMVLRNLLTSAVRLGIVGPMESQALQHALGSHGEEVATRCSLLTSADISQTAPLLDLMQGAHDRLYSRLFQT